MGEKEKYSSSTITAAFLTLRSCQYGVIYTSFLRHIQKSWNSSDFFDVGVALPKLD